jgi:hypothetical protein
MQMILNQKLYYLVLFLCFSMPVLSYAENVTNYTYDKSGHMLSGISTTEVFDDDGDGVSNEDEKRNGTDPDDPDSDGDFLPDGWELDNGLDPLVYNAAGDDDFDGVSNIEEFLRGTDPNSGINLNLVLRNMIVKDNRNRDYRASNSIQVAPLFIIASGFNVVLKAGSTIHFKPGFVALKGSTLHARVK